MHPEVPLDLDLNKMMIIVFAHLTTTFALFFVTQNKIA